MRKKTQLKLLLIKEIIDFNIKDFDIKDFDIKDFDIKDYLYINSGLSYGKNILEYIIGVFLKR